MRLAALRDEIEKDLLNAKTQTHFSRLRVRIPELQAYPTMFSLLAVLEARGTELCKERERLLRVLVDLAQKDTGERLWRQTMLYTFLPGLINLVARTKKRYVLNGVRADVHEKGDLDGSVWTAFLEALAKYNHSCKGHLAYGLLRATRRRYFKILRAELAAYKRRLKLLSYAELCADEPFSIADLEVPSPPSELPLGDLLKVRAEMEACGAISSEDADIVWATKIRGFSIWQYMEARGLTKADDDHNRREYQRLQRRCHRAQATLRRTRRKKAKNS